MKIRALVSGITLACASLAAEAAVNIVVNNSFEAQQIAGPWQSLGSIDGWQSTDGFDIQQGSNFQGRANFNAAIDGRQYLELNGRQFTTLSQNLTTSAGGLYQLNFLYSGRPDQTSSEDSSMNVLWNGSIVGNVSAAGNSGWQSFSFNRLPAGTNGLTQLSFQSTGPSSQPSYGSYLDRVSVSAVPESGIAAMMALGLGMLVLVGSRRDNQDKFDVT